MRYDNPMNDTPDTSQFAEGEEPIAVMLVRGMDMESKPIYAYVAVPYGKVEAFVKAQQKPNFDPAQYGEIITANYGEPDEQTKAYMKEHYNFDHDEMIDIPVQELAQSGNTFSDSEE